MTAVNGLIPLDTEDRVLNLEDKLGTLAWLHAELAYQLKMMIAQQLAAALQPQIQHAILNQLTGGTTQ